MKRIIFIALITLYVVLLATSCSPKYGCPTNNGIVKGEFNK